MPKKSTIRTKHNVARDLANRLVLQEWVFAKLGVSTFTEIQDLLNDDDAMDGDLDAYESALTNALKNGKTHRSISTIGEPDLQGYHERVAKYWKQITARRNNGVPLQLKYFQYVALMGAEVYLDAYFSNKKMLLDQLNDIVQHYNESYNDPMAIYQEQDLRKLAYWQATGSGKTLIMHVNILQYSYYAAKAGVFINNLVLLTPNEGLTAQHVSEFELSDGVNARRFDGSQGFGYGDYVEVIDIHKLEFQNNVTGNGVTVAIESFGTDNLLLVDEGHRGSSGRDWLNKRRKLLEGGFTFEYSATFREAVDNDEKLKDEYSKCIIFDYSYRFFYGDGYGKESRIFNVSDTITEDQRFTYLVGSLVAYYEQLRYFEEYPLEARTYNISKPLMVFVGNSVSASNRETTDVIDVINLLADFCRPDNRQQVERAINGVFSTNPNETVVNQNRQIIFANHFMYLRSLYALTGLAVSKIYEDMLKRIFNCKNGTTGILHLSESEEHGEILVRVGNPELGNRPFALISVGNTTDLVKKIREYDEKRYQNHDESAYELTKDRFAKSHFTGLSDNEDLNMLIGSRKFTEGWNSYRVSIMVLLNMGAGQGTQIIQLFGRGIRLLGYNKTLKRSTELSRIEVPSTRPHKYMQTLETLNVFGVRANYINTFAKTIKDAIPDIAKTEVVVRTRPTQSVHPELHVVVSQPGVKRFEDTDAFELHYDEHAPHKIKVRANYYMKLTVGTTGDTKSTGVNYKKFTQEQVRLFDYEKLHTEIVNYKRSKEYHNLRVTSNAIRRMFVDEGGKNAPDWYEMLIDDSELIFTDMSKLLRWQEIAENLMKRYCDALYRAQKSAYTVVHRMYRILKEHEADEPNLLESVRVIVPDNADGLRDSLNELNGYTAKTHDRKPGIKGVHFQFDRHLYEPVFSDENGDLKTVPTALNKGERTFLEDVTNYVQKNTAYFNDKKLFVLRNLSRGHGFYFYEGGNFYPDFLVWLVTEEHEYITFVDPKGLVQLDRQNNNPKVEFYRNIKQIERQLHASNMRIILNSFLISVTPYNTMKTLWNKEDIEQFNDMHILFQDDQRDSYIRIMFEKMGLTDVPDQHRIIREAHEKSPQLSYQLDDSERIQSNLFGTE